MNKKVDSQEAEEAVNTFSGQCVTYWQDIELKKRSGKIDSGKERRLKAKIDQWMTQVYKANQIDRKG